MILAWLTRTVAAGLVTLFVVACAGTPTDPNHATVLTTGRWTGNGACLSVAPDGCDLVAGCGHGQFPMPPVDANGTFQIDGTYRVEAGPISINPPPPATFSGVQKGQTLTLTVTPRDSSLQPATYVVQLTNASGKCTVPCV